MMHWPTVLLYAHEAGRARAFAEAARSRGIRTLTAPTVIESPLVTQAVAVIVAKPSLAQAPSPGQPSLVVPAALSSAAAGRPPSAAAAASAAPVVPAGEPDLGPLLAQLAAEGTPALVWGLDKPPVEAPGHVDFAPLDSSLDELFGRIAALARFGPQVLRLEREITHLERLGRQLNRYFAEVDQELRLAGRLQRDFLPRDSMLLPGLRCVALFQPATWVSGDMYDLFRIDEHHVGIFVADAMGHGLAAAIMTMFLRQALHVRELDGHAYRIQDPVAAMGLLNDSLLRQKLPNQHFVTAVYGAIDTRSYELRICRGGHPYPLLVSRDFEISELRADGPLLGIPDVPIEFEEARVTLQPGEKLVLYTDGLEDVLLDAPPAGAPAASSADGQPPAFSALLRELARLDAESLVDTLRSALDRREGSLAPADDVTLVVLERVATARDIAGA